MRFQGKIITWNDDRGFGFIEWNGGKDKVFVHISAFLNRRRRPAVGDIVIYEVTKDERGRARAKSVAFPQTRKTRSSSRPKATKPWRAFALLIPFAIAGYCAYVIYVQPALPPGTPARADPQPLSFQPKFHCEGKTHCSHMTSCEEATFYLINCPDTKIDGDHDGIPCESQWCGH